jgi:hypothetical protein
MWPLKHPGPRGLVLGGRSARCPEAWPELGRLAGNALLFCWWGLEGGLTAWLLEKDAFWDAAATLRFVWGNCYLLRQLCIPTMGQQAVAACFLLAENCIFGVPLADCKRHAAGCFVHIYLMLELGHLALELLVLISQAGVLMSPSCVSANSAGPTECLGYFKSLVCVILMYSIAASLLAAAARAVR